MEVAIRTVGAAPEALVDLAEWLSGENELRGRVRIVNGPIGGTELGTVVDLLTVALGAGGAGTVLASSIVTWLQTRRTTVKVTVKSPKGSVTLDIQTVGDVAPLLDHILRPADHDD
jgi:predicted dehydrogenase